MPAVISPINVARNLLPLKFRDIEIPWTSGTFGFDQSLAPHLYPDRDGGFIESPGRNPSRFAFTGLFLNGITGEKDILFPTRWLKLVSACADRSVGILNHPALGPIKVKPVKCETTWDSEKLDGVTVALEFVETTDSEDELAKILAGSSPMAVAISAAADVDAECADVSPPPEYPESVSPSLLETMKGLSGSLDQFKRGIGNIDAGIDSILGGLDELSRILDKNKDDPNIARAQRAVTRAFDAVVNVSLTATTQGKQVTTAIVKNESTLDAVAAFFSMGLDDFNRLNPRAAIAPKVPKGSRVFVLA